MGILLDTQALLWLAEGSPRLSQQSKRLIRDRANRIYVSYISLLEATLKAATGKLVFEVAIIDELEKCGVDIIPADRDLLETYQVFDDGNKDPFDNLLVATAIQHQLTLLTSDKKILELDVTGLQTRRA